MNICLWLLFIIFQLICVVLPSRMLSSQDEITLHVLYHAVVQGHGIRSLVDFDGFAWSFDYLKVEDLAMLPLSSIPAIAYTWQDNTLTLVIADMWMQNITLNDILTYEPAEGFILDVEIRRSQLGPDGETCWSFVNIWLE